MLRDNRVVTHFSLEIITPSDSSALRYFSLLIVQLRQIRLEVRGLGSRDEGPGFNSQFKNNSSAEMWSGSDEGSYLRLID